MKETHLNNVELSSEIIVFDPQTDKGQLVILNKHNKFGVSFKIKTTRQKAFQVKPPKGFIKPMSQQHISFKINNKSELKDLSAAQKTDKFLLQIINLPNQNASKEEIDELWKSVKDKTANLQNGYGNYKININLTGQKQLKKSNVPITLKNLQAGGNSQIYQSAMKKNRDADSQFKLDESQKKSNDKNSLVRFKDEEGDTQLAKKYQQLKKQQENLVQKRSKILISQSPSQKSSGSGMKKWIIIVILFFLSFLGGNFVRSKMVRKKRVQ